MTDSLLRPGTTVVEDPNIWAPIPRTARSWLRALVSSTQTDLAVHCIVLFGSVARRTESIGDVDILMISDSKPVFRKRPIEVDLRWYLSERIEELIQEGNDLLGWCVLFGRLIYEADGFWTHVTARWSERIPLPSLDISEARAAKAEQLLLEMQRIGDRDAIEEQNLAFLTHKARSNLIREGVYPKSRPELSTQLREIGNAHMAQELEEAIIVRPSI